MQRYPCALPPMPRIVVYGLAISDNRGTMRFFFVGGLLRTPNFGVAQHVAWLRSVHPALSQHLALLDGNDACTVRAIILRECDAHEEYDGLPYKAQLDDNVRYETICLMRMGHTLLNSRCGTPQERAALIADAVGASIRSGRDLEIRRELLRKRAQRNAMRDSAIDLMRKEWLRGRTHERDSRSLCFLFSRAFPAAWRRLERIPAFSLPPSQTDLADALCQLIGQARATRLHPVTPADCVEASKRVKRHVTTLNAVDPLPASLSSRSAAERKARRNRRYKSMRPEEVAAGTPAQFAVVAE
jgi:hypothetical protein